MSNVWAIAWKELRVYFQTPTAYIVGSMFVLQAGIWFGFNIAGVNPEASVRPWFGQASNFFILLAPLLTMRLLAEEQKLGTMELLLTAPIRDWEVVVGKYIASAVTLIVTLAFTLYFVLMIYVFGGPDSGPIMAAYLGMILYGGAALSIGAAVLGIGTLGVLTVIDNIGTRLGGAGKEIVDGISLDAHFTDFARGIVDISHLVYYLSIIAVFLFLTVRAVETRRWR